MPEQSDDPVGQKPLVVGVTGMAGSGKSTVTRYLSALGAQTADADALVRWAYNDPMFRRSLRSRFGDTVLNPDGTVNRAALAEVIFSNDAARLDLEAMVHPAVLGQMIEMIEIYRAEPARAPMLALEIPLLYEAGADTLVDRVLVVAASAETCASRLRQRGWDEERIMAVARAQLPLEVKVDRAEDVIFAEGTLDETIQAVEEYWNRLVSVRDA